MGTNYRSFEDLPLTLTVEEAGQILRVGRNTAYDLVRCGKLRSIKVGKQIRIPKQALQDYLSRQKQLTQCRAGSIM